MKKFITSIVLMLSLNVYCQYDKWEQYLHFDERTYVFTVTHQDYDQNLIGNQTDFLFFHDTTYMEIKIDTFSIDYLKAIYDHGIPYSILWTDSTGYFHVSSVAEIPITYNQIVDSLGFEPLKTLTGKDTLSGVNGMTAYVVAHNYGYIPVITLTPRSADAAAACYISDIDSNTFTITFTNQPPVGTDNIIFDWVAIKP